MGAEEMLSRIGNIARRYGSATTSERGRAWREATMNLLGAIRFRVLRIPRLSTYVAYKPESDFVAASHPELRALSRGWRYRNERVNGGDFARFYTLAFNVKQVLQSGVSGDVAELGVYRGNSALMLAHYARAFGRKALLFDTFSGFDPRDLQRLDKGRPIEFGNTSIEAVKTLLGEDDAVRYVVGYFPISASEYERKLTYAFVHLDCDLYEPIRAGLEFFYPRLSPGGAIVIHDYSSGSWPGVTAAVDEFCRTIPEQIVLIPDRSGTAILRKNAARNASH